MRSSYQAFGRGQLDHLPAHLAGELTLTAYRVAQEGLNNALKHSKASEINLSLQLGGHSFALSVQDNGCGFDPSNFGGQPGAGGGETDRIASGNGLANMRKRLEEIGGRCSIISRPGGGTRITLSLTIH